MSAPAPGSAPADESTRREGGLDSRLASSSETRYRRLPAGPRGDAVAVLGTSLLLGLVGGVLWWLLVKPALFTVGPENTLGMGEVQLAQRFAATGWFTVLAAGFGALSGGALTWWRNRDPLLTVGLLVAGSVLGTFTMAFVGGLLGPPDPEVAARTAAPRDQVPAALHVGATVAYLVWTIAALAGALMVLWSPATDVET